MELTSRELASVIIIAVFIVLGLLLGKDRRGILDSIVALVHAFAKWKIWSVLLGYVVYVVAAIAAANWLGVWSGELLKDTIVIAIFTGLPILFNATGFKDGTAIVVHVTKQVLGVAAVLAFYLNLTPLSLWGELILQVLLLVFVLLALVGSRKPETAPIGRFFNGVVGIIVVGLAIYTAVQVGKQFESLDWRREARTVALTVWLPLSLIPAVYLFGLLASCETALLRMKLLNRKSAPPLRIRLAFLLGVHGSLRYATGLTGLWLSDLAEQTSFTSARWVMRQYRRAVRSNARKNRQRQHRLKKRAGLSGTDKNGLWVDRREFHETKQALEALFYSQMGLYRNRGNHYWADPIAVFPAGGFKDLPEDHGIQFAVRDDGQVWMAWRRTVGGLNLGVGGTDDVDAYWRYFGVDSPSGYPDGADAGGWMEVSTSNGTSPEWETNDAPLPRA